MRSITYCPLRLFHFRRFRLMTTIEKKFVDLVDVIMDEIPEHLWDKLDPEDIIWDEDIPSPKYHVLSEW